MSRTPRSQQSIGFPAILAIVASAIWVLGVLFSAGELVSAVRDGPDRGCLAQQPYDLNFSPESSPERIRAEGQFLLFPLGLDCIYIASDTGEVAHRGPNLLPTITLGVASALTIASIAGALGRRQPIADR